MNYKRGDVVLVPFPFTDLTTTKRRPALVISTDLYNRSQVNLIIAAITSQTHRLGIGDCLIQNLACGRSGKALPSKGNYCNYRTQPCS